MVLKIGSNFGELIEGTDDADIILALGGDDTVLAKGGNDAVKGGKGNDKIEGGDGDDRLYGEYGNDVIIGDRGNDKMYGGSGNDRLIWNNGDGSDLMNGGTGYDVVEVNGAAQAGDEFTLKADAHKAIFDRLNLVPFTLTVDNVESFEINGLGGNDKLDVDDLTGTDVRLVKFSGGEGNDYLDGRDTATRIVAYGDDGHDKLFGGSANDSLYGGKDNDLVVGGRGGDRMFGQAGNDRLVWNNGDGSDLMDGGTGYDVIEVNGAGQAGDEFTLKADGRKAIFDRVNLVPFTLTVDNAEAFEISGLGGDDTLDVDDLTGTDVRVVKFFGGEGNDKLDASNTKTKIIAYGDAGDDTLIGGKADDILKGGEGNDVLTGGEGADKFVFDAFQQGVDTVLDFSAEDILVIRGAGFGGGLTSGKTISADQYTTGPSASDASHRFIYNNNGLYYDSDGIGGNAQVQLAKFAAGTNLTHTNIYVA